MIGEFIGYSGVEGRSSRRGIDTGARFYRRFWMERG